MKFFAATAVAAFAATSVSATTCVLTDLATELADVITPAYACQTATGYTLIPPSALPTSAQVAAICSKCQDLIAGVKKITLPTCTLTIDGTAVGLDKLFNEIVNECSASGSSSAASGTVGSNTTTTTAPASSGSSGEDVTTPTTTTSTPSTTTSSPSSTTAAPSTSTSAGVAASLGAAVAVACSVAALML